MRAFLMLFVTNIRWFVGTLVAVFFLWLFFWNLFAHDSFVASFQILLDDIVEILKYIAFYTAVALFIYWGFRLILRGVSGGGRRGHH